MSNLTQAEASVAALEMLAYLQARTPDGGHDRLNAELFYTGWVQDRSYYGASGSNWRCLCDLAGQYGHPDAYNWA